MMNELPLIVRTNFFLFAILFANYLLQLVVAFDSILATAMFSVNSLKRLFDNV